MKNKEIEELLNMLKKCAREDKATLKLNEIACRTILSYIEQLEKEKDYIDDYNRHLLKENKQLENNRDKAIEILENRQNNLFTKEARKTLDDDIEIALNILKGDNNGN